MTVGQDPHGEPLEIEGEETGYPACGGIGVLNNHTCRVEGCGGLARTLYCLDDGLVGMGKRLPDPSAEAVGVVGEYAQYGPSGVHGG